jgi:hypothetical protein
MELIAIFVIAIIILMFLAIFVVLPIVSLDRINTLARRLKELEIKVQELQNTARQTEAEGEPAEILSPAQPSTVSCPEPQRPLSAELKPQSRTREEWEAFIGEKLFNRIGALAVIIGIGFFLKYSFNHNWISETVRVLIGLASGAALLLGGERLHKKGLRVFAQGLLGAGISVLYLSVYASFNFYHLVPQNIAFVFMAAVTALAFLQAVKYNSLVISLLGWAGGFLTPLLFSSGSGHPSNEVGLFVYITLLAAGLLLISFKKDSWVVLEPLTLAAVYLVYLSWYLRFYGAQDFLPAILFLTVFWSLFFVLDIIRANPSFPFVSQGVAAFNAVFYYAAAYSLIDPLYHPWTGLLTLTLAIIYFTALLALKRRRPDAKTVHAQYVLTAVILLVIFSAVQFSGFVKIACWSIEALLLFWCGGRWKQRYVTYFALILFAFTIPALFFTEGAFTYYAIDHFALILNFRALAFAVLAAALGASIAFCGQLEEKIRKPVCECLRYSWCAILFILITVETNDYFRRLLLAATTQDSTQGLIFTEYLTLALVWTLYSLPLAWYGLQRRVRPYLYLGLGVMSLAVVMTAVRGAAFTPLKEFVLLLNFRAYVFFFVVAALFVHAQWLSKNRKLHDWIDKALPALHCVIALLVFELISCENRDYFNKLIKALDYARGFESFSAGIVQLKDFKQLMLSGIWLLYSALLLVIGMWRRLALPRFFAIILFGITILKVFILDLSFLSTLYRIFSFIGLGVILLGASYLYQHYKSAIFDRTPDGQHPQ